MRVGSLASTRRILEAQLEIGRHIEVARLKHEHAQLGTELHPDDREHELFELEQQVMHLLPKVVRGGFVLTLWSVLEVCIKDIATRAGERVGKQLA